MYQLDGILIDRKKRRREFAERRDKECEGMTEEQKQEWIQKQKDESNTCIV